MKQNPLKKLTALDQSIWLDYIRRDLVTSGELQRLMVDDELRGMTSNPSIFEKAITGSHDYDVEIRTLKHLGNSVPEIYEALSQKDVKSAADIFWPVYERSRNVDGFVSLEVNPHLAHDTEGSIREGRRLWAALNRQNILIKIPGTSEGLPAIRQLLSEGINVNVTLLFGVTRYRQVVEAYLAGIGERLNRGKPVVAVTSVASFFVSRIDALIDPMLEKIMAQNGPEADLAGQAHGQVAIASARMAYQTYLEFFRGSRFRELKFRGASNQRLLWASTGTKNPTYSDVKYIEALIGPNTVNTVPLESLNDYRDHGDPRVRLTDDLDLARRVFEILPQLGINIDEVTQRLEDEGVAKFSTSFDNLMAALKTKVE